MTTSVQAPGISSSACYEHILPAITFTIDGSSLPTWRTTNLMMLRCSALTFAPLQGSTAHLIVQTSETENILRHKQCQNDLHITQLICLQS
uniref:Uncharacterized protein n=1 Tax=Onchocerca volvulus TaxID=6282 RepID=A0A8R1XXG9_ONCVO